MSVTGADVVYKDVIEPLESVSVTITDTTKGDVTDFGELNQAGSAPLAVAVARTAHCAPVPTQTCQTLVLTCVCNPCVSVPPRSLRPWLVKC